MEINTERVNRVVIPRRALAKRICILWIFEILACLCGFGLFSIFSVFCIIEAVWLTLKFRPVWNTYYHPATLYILLILLVIPALPLGIGLRWSIKYLISELPLLFI